LLGGSNFLALEGLLLLFGNLFHQGVHRDAVMQGGLKALGWGLEVVQEFLLFKVSST
jgi:hypothetical protein